MSGAHRKPSRTSRAAGRLGRTGATATLGGIAALGLGAGMASAGTLTHAGGASVAGESATGPSSSLVDLSHNQVPVQDATGSLGITGLHSTGHTAAGSDASCHIAAAQQN
jgi:hypothetical protein